MLASSFYIRKIVTSLPCSKVLAKGLLAQKKENTKASVRLFPACELPEAVFYGQRNCDSAFRPGISIFKVNHGILI